MRTISDPLRASLRPDGVGSWPLTTLLVLMWLKSAATPAVDRSVLWLLLQFSPQLQSLEAAIGCFVATHRVHRGCRREQAERHEGSTSSTGTTAGQCHRQHRGRRPWRPTATELYVSTQILQRRNAPSSCTEAPRKRWGRRHLPGRQWQRKLVSGREWRCGVRRTWRMQLNEESQRTAGEKGVVAVDFVCLACLVGRRR